MIHRLGLGVAVGAALLPWSVLRWLGEASPYVTFLDGPSFAYTTAGLLLGAAALGALDVWLGLLVAYAAVGAFVTGTDLGLATAHWMLLGAAGLVAVRHVTPAWARWALLASATLEVAVAGYQITAWADPLFSYGTFGNTKYLGAFLAVVTPLAPAFLLPTLMVGVVLSRSGVSVLAILAGLAVRPATWRVRLGLVGLGLAGVLGVALTRGTMTYTLDSRLATWAVALGQYTPLTLLTGHGFGAWYAQVPRLQIAAGLNPEDLYVRSHSDLVQLAYEGGLIALCLLAGWLWRHRRALWASPWRGAALAVGIEATLLHPFHLSTVAPACLVVLGLATREP